MSLVFCVIKIYLPKILTSEFVRNLFRIFKEMLVIVLLLIFGLCDANLILEKDYDF